MGALVGVGGVTVPANNLCGLNEELEIECKAVGLPPAQMFKWSPSRSDWIRENLVGEERTNFFCRILKLCRDYDAQAVVAVCDVTKKTATKQASSNEMDAYLLALERFHSSLKNTTGYVVIAKPSGGNKSENKMLAECIEHNRYGTDYVQFNKLAQNPTIVPSGNSRLLQASDLVVSTATAMCAGNVDYARGIFDDFVRPMLLEDWRGLKGNTGLKLHPSILYENVYHWLLGENYVANGRRGIPIPKVGKPYCQAPNRY